MMLTPRAQEGADSATADMNGALIAPPLRNAPGKINSSSAMPEGARELSLS